MLQINTNRQQYCQIYQTPYAVIRFIWIAAFGVSTKFVYLLLILFYLEIFHIAIFTRLSLCGRAFLRPPAEQPDVAGYIAAALLL